MPDHLIAIEQDAEDGHTACAAHDLAQVQAIGALVRGVMAACKTGIVNYPATREALMALHDTLDSALHDELNAVESTLEQAVERHADQPGGNRPWRYGTSYRPQYSLED